MEQAVGLAKRAVAPDFLASVVVFLVALPLCMGIAIASGAPPAAGLVTGIIGGLVVGTIQGSPLQVSGPAAGLAVIVWELIQRHGLSFLGMVVLLAGFIQGVAALLKGGRWFRAVPPSVIHGMLGGIGVLIFASQFHVMVDDSPKSSGILNLVTLPLAVWKGIASSGDLPHQEAALTGVATIASIVLWTRIKGPLSMVPGPLVGVLLGTCLAWFFQFEIAYVSVPSDLIGSLNLPSSQTWRLLAQPAVWGAALGVAAVASAETLLCSTAVDRMHAGPRTDYNRELLAQGIGNMLCGLLCALPMTGVIVRSSANVQAGAQSRLSAIMHGGWLTLLVLVLPQVLSYVPVASLAAILVFTGYRLIDPAAIKELRKYGRAEVAIYAATVVGIVTTDLLKGVLFGLALAIGRLLYQVSHLRVVVESDAAARRTTLHLRGVATFFRLAEIADALERVPDDHELSIGTDNLDYVDHGVLELLTNFEKQHRSRGGRTAFDWEALTLRNRAKIQSRDSPSHVGA